MELNINRLFLLIRRQLIKDWKKYAIAIAAGVLGAVFISALSCINSRQLDMSIYQKITAILFFIGGAIISSTIFKEIEKPETGYQYMTLPVSNLEKLSAAWIISFLLYWIIASLSISVGGLLLNVVKPFGVEIIGEAFEFFPMFEFGKYLLALNAVFLAGAAAFKGNAFLKTNLFMMVYSTFLSAISGITLWVFYKSNPNPFTETNGSQIHISNSNFMLQNTTGQVILFVCVIVFIWILAYFKLKERTL